LSFNDDNLSNYEKLNTLIPKLNSLIQNYKINIDKSKNFIPIIEENEPFYDLLS